MENKYDVFISTSAESAKDADLLGGLLKDRGLKVSSAAGCTFAGDVEEGITNAIKDSKLFVIHPTSSKADSPWSLFELGIAMGLNKRIVVWTPPEFGREEIQEPLKTLGQHLVTSGDTESIIRTNCAFLRKWTPIPVERGHSRSEATPEP